MSFSPSSACSSLDDRPTTANGYCASQSEQKSPLEGISNPNSQAALFPEMTSTSDTRPIVFTTEMANEAILEVEKRRFDDIVQWYRTHGHSRKRHADAVQNEGKKAKNDNENPLRKMELMTHSADFQSNSIDNVVAVTKKEYATKSQVDRQVKMRAPGEGQASPMRVAGEGQSPSLISPMLSPMLSMYDPRLTLPYSSPSPYQYDMPYPPINSSMNHSMNSMCRPFSSMPPSFPGVPPSFPGVPPSFPGVPPSFPGVPPSFPGVPPSFSGVPPSFSGMPPSYPPMVYPPQLSGMTPPQHPTYTSLSLSNPQ